MAMTTSLGIGTGVDLQSMLTKIVAAERAPITALDTKISAMNTKVSVYGTIKSKLDTLRSAAETLQFPSRLSALSAASSDATVAGAVASHTAAAGSYAIEVTQLAAAQKTVSQAYEANTVFGAGTLSFTFADDPMTPHDVSIAAGDSLAQISSKINGAAIGITATVISGTSGDRLVLTSTDTGSDNAFTFSSTVPAPDTPSNPGTPQSLLQNSDAALAVTARNATIKVDGIPASSSSNTFTSTVTGLTLTAVKEGTSTVTVKTDSAKITSAVQAFVDSYNAVVSLVKANTAYDSNTKTGQPLTGDTAARSILSALGSARTSIPGELSSASLKTLSELGVTIQQSGLLTLDSTKLSSAIGASAGNVTKAVNAYGRTFSEAINGLLGTGGVLSNRVDSLNASVKRAKASQDALEVRVANIEKRYRAQFTALDKTVSSMQTTSSYLTQQLASLQAQSS